MIKKSILVKNRVRRIEGGFSFIPHKFLFDNYFNLLSKDELALYFLLILASDKNGISYFSYKKICNILHFDIENYTNIRNSLIDKSLIAFDGKLFQVLSLPKKILESKLLTSTDDFINHDHATIKLLCSNSLK